MTTEQIRELCGEIADQDNRATQYPIYQVLKLETQLANADDRDSYEVRVDEEWIIGKVWEIDWIDYFWEDYVKEFLVEEEELFGELEDDDDIKALLTERELDIEDYIQNMNNNLFKQYVKPVRIPHHDNFFLTQNQAEKFRRENAHNMEDPIIYVVSAYRNEQIKLIVQHLFEQSWVELPHFWR